MMTIKQRIAALRLGAQATKSLHLRKFLGESADVLEALSCQYNRLHHAAKDAISRSNGLDPAMHLVAQEIQNQSLPTAETVAARQN